MENLSFWEPLVIGSIPGSIIMNIDCAKIHSVTISVCFDRETAKCSTGEEVGPVSPEEWWALLNIYQGYVRENIENHERARERMICWFFDDNDSITLNDTSTNVSDHVAGCICHKLKLYDECCNQLFLSDKPIIAYIRILSTGGLENRSMRLRGTVAKAFVHLMHLAMLSGVQHWTQKVPKIWYFRNFSIHHRYFVMIMFILLFIWLALSANGSLMHRERL